MRKLIPRLLLALLLAVILVVSHAPNATAPTCMTVTLWIGSPFLSVNGKLAPIDVQGTTPIILEGRTLVPIRAVIEACGGAVAWEAPARRITISLGSGVLDLWEDRPTASLNGTVVTIDTSNPDVVPTIIRGRTMVPLRFVSESLGIGVAYDPATRAVTLTYVPVPPTESEPKLAPLRVDFIDVGQGDCILIQTPNRSWVLIDAGDGSHAPTLVEYLRARGVQRLSVVICTHPHEDHIGGMKAVLDACAVDLVYMPRTVTTTRAYEDFLLAVEAKGIPMIEAKAGVQVSVDPSTQFWFLSPIRSTYDDLNDCSTVLKVTHGTVSFLLMGDAGTLVEADLVKGESSLRADVLKVGHHGSSSSIGTEFVRAVQPKYAVIEVGKDNGYGHPAQEVLRELSLADISVYRTDQDGSVEFTTDGVSIAVRRTGQ